MYQKNCYICKNTRNCLSFARLRKQLAEAQEGDSISFRMPESCGFKVVENDGLMCDECWQKYLENYGQLGVMEMCDKCRMDTLNKTIE